MRPICYYYKTIKPNTYYRNVREFLLSDDLLKINHMILHVYGYQLLQPKYIWIIILTRCIGFFLNNKFDLSKWIE